ncbi:MAG: hypothetical protein ABIW80_08540 [Lapillicoccus sp.]
MDRDEARTLLTAERTHVEQQLAGSRASLTEEHESEAETGDLADPAQALTGQGIDDAVATALTNRLDAIDRALGRVDDGTYGRSVRSGLPIPQERLEADPAAELTVEEVAADEAANR